MKGAPKGHRRDIPLATDLAEAVGEHMVRCGTGPGGVLLQTITGTLVTPSDYSSVFRKVMKTLGYDWSRTRHLSPHATGRAVKGMDVTLASTVLTWC